MNRDDAPLQPSREDLLWGWCFVLSMVACMVIGMFLALAWLPPVCRAESAAWHANAPRAIVEPVCMALGASGGLLCAAAIARWLQRHRVPAETRRRWHRQFDVALAQAAPIAKPVMRALHRLLFVRD